ncbi:MAG: NHL repeat-containing protein [Candidatus Eremiobacteraeota bacterium]|nr:NHL repeat-containing protein [Candidatus Eremiobacteraeota bacterium]
MHKLLVTLGTVSLLTGCSPARSPLMPPAVSQTAAQSERAATQNIYVTQYSNNSLTKFTLAGKQVWSITNGLTTPRAVTVDAHGKIFVANGNDTITTYDRNGNQTTPTIKSGLDQPFGVAVDHAGKIYVTNLGNDVVTTYKPDGTRTTPTITGLDGVGGITVDAHGKIYVVNSAGGSVQTYTPSGQRTKPTITDGLHEPVDVKVDASGKIWVSNNKNPAAITSYTASGKRVSPTITKALDGIYCIALSSDRIYAANKQGGNITTYTLSEGRRTVPTIGGLGHALTGVAFH